MEGARYCRIPMVERFRVFAAPANQSSGRLVTTPDPIIQNVKPVSWNNITECREKQENGFYKKARDRGYLNFFAGVPVKGEA